MSNQAKWVYKTALWEAMRQEQLRIEPLCRYCDEMGLTVAATVVNHIKPHRGDRSLAFDPNNLESVCKECHDRHCQAQDKGLPVAGCDADGWPLDPKHPWGDDK